MSTNAPARVRVASVAAWRSFVRRRTAVFFTFVFPVILVVIFGALVRTTATAGSGGLFTEPAGYYVPGYLAVVVLFTPLTRVGSEVARHRAGNRFEKLATTPLTRWEWLAAQTAVNVVVIGLATVLVFGLTLVLTGADVTFSPLLVPFVALGVTLFCGVGAVLGRISDSQDGAVAASNAVALPLLFLSETFVPPSMLPGWFGPLLSVSPLTYFSRGIRAATFTQDGTALANLAVLAVLAAVAFVVGAAVIPRTD
jgi:ABC-2 type transport system permease protein